MDSLQEKLSKRVCRLLISGQIKRPIKPKLVQDLVVEIETRLFESRICQNYVLFEPDPEFPFPRIVFGPSSLNFEQTGLFDQLQIETYRYQVWSSSSTYIGYLVPDDFSFHDPLLRFRTIWKRWSHHKRRAITVVRKDQSIQLIGLTHDINPFRGTVLSIELLNSNMRRMSGRDGSLSSKYDSFDWSRNNAILKKFSAS